LEEKRVGWRLGSGDELEGCGLEERRVEWRLGSGEEVEV
jgi:hypothetical protein